MTTAFLLPIYLHVQHRQRHFEWAIRFRRLSNQLPLKPRLLLFHLRLKYLHPMQLLIYLAREYSQNKYKPDINIRHVKSELHPLCEFVLHLKVYLLEHLQFYPKQHLHGLFHRNYLSNKHQYIHHWQRRHQFRNIEGLFHSLLQYPKHIQIHYGNKRYCTTVDLKGDILH